MLVTLAQLAAEIGEHPEDLAERLRPARLTPAAVEQRDGERVERFDLGALLRALADHPAPPRRLRSDAAAPWRPRGGGGASFDRPRVAVTLSQLAEALGIAREDVVRALRVAGWPTPVRSEPHGGGSIGFYALADVLDALAIAAEETALDRGGAT